ncbi:hypothetical protein EDD86DRAFT_213104 [Gorgonomyces haynaldii]|nr:hypothetical protein EDD86DRAFT_213104 [Gorgonomyces haynaldii]
MLILAPMVRVGTTPMRLMALKYGADMVYSPEIIDRRLIRSQRLENKQLGTIDFVDDTGTLNLRVHSSERDKLIVQIGSADPQMALEAAQKVQDDCAGIDLNCGCPKKFSVSGGMGSRLLEDPDRLVSILESLVKGLKIPVSCKIRLLDPKHGLSAQERTIALLQRIERIGVVAVAVHCRFTHERPRQPGHWDYFESLSQSISIPLIANGDIYSLQDMNRLKAQAPLSRFMLARAAQSNVSVFSGSLKPSADIMKEYVQTSIKLGMHFQNCKYTLMQMQVDGDPKEGILFRETINKIKDWNSLCAYFDLNPTDLQNSYNDEATDELPIKHYTANA